MLLADRKWYRCETAPLISFDHMSAQRISRYEFSPPQLRITLFGRWEFGLVLGHWWLGWRLKQPLLWLRRLQPA
jgi:hypothetical protein